MASIRVLVCLSVGRFLFAQPCAFTFSPNSQNLPHTGTSLSQACPGVESGLQCGFDRGTDASVFVTPSAACSDSPGPPASWTSVSSNPGILHIVTSQDTGSGYIQFNLLNNTHLTPRTFTITTSAVVGSGTASSIYNVTQDGSPLSRPVGQVYREVYALYQQFLRRDADAAGFTFWTGTGNAGLGQMAYSFLTGPEAYNRDFGVIMAYQAVTGAPPTYAQLAAALAAGESAVEQIFLGYGLVYDLVAANPGVTVTTFYQNLLDRQPTASEAANCGVGTVEGLPGCFEFITGYPDLKAPVGDANSEFQNTGIFAGGPDHTNALYIRMLYYLTLGRDPDPAGFAFWTGVANQFGPGLLFQGQAGAAGRLQILGPGTPGQGFIGSPEFQGLFAN